MLAMIEFNKTKKQDMSGEELHDTYKQGFQYLKAAYDADKHHPVAGLLLGKHFTLIDAPEKAMKLALKASNSTGLKNVQSEGFYIMAKISHQKGAYSEACSLYQKAVSFNPDNHMAQFGLGQTLLFKQDIASAITAFERILAKEPKCVEAIAVSRRAPHQDLKFQPRSTYGLYLY